MTLGDRVAVMNGGVLQQVATPRELYSRPANLFVASFIGSPAMNLWEARLDGGTLRTPIGEIAVGDRLRRTLEGNRPLDGRVVVGTRPEDIVALDASQNGRPGHVFEAPVVLTESVGPDLYAHFQVDVEDEGPSLVPAASAASHGWRPRTRSVGVSACASGSIPSSFMSSTPRTAGR